MRNNDHSGSLELLPPNHFLNAFLTHRVNVGSGFVQDHQVVLSEEAATEGDELLLTVGEGGRFAVEV